jgi:hypothetical protein
VIGSLTRPGVQLEGVLLTAAVKAAVRAAVTIS